MPPMKSKYKVKWEEEMDANGQRMCTWVIKIDDFTVKCKFCENKLV